MNTLPVDYLGREQFKYVLVNYDSGRILTTLILTEYEAKKINYAYSANSVNMRFTKAPTN
ncbi:hypothetical protein [uncultured Mucilaginibacter sp.]|uniref:hypothetical protein n=1 Tax=uncultured Mucilaginibacter sp. TaxID=797541 RepID=UPI0025F1B6FD|nr:hypothetical protein [uncultured Mucilaginibacter sp.]